MIAEARRDLLSIFEAAVAAVDPEALMRGYLARAEGTPAGPTLVIGAGKASARMALACESVLGVEHVSGMVIVPDGCAAPLRRIGVAIAGHPLPDQRGVDATDALWHELTIASANRVLCLISGGASSVLIRPRPPLTLADKMEVNRLLLASGAAIGEFNTVRKHLSTVKGGGLLRAIRQRPIETVILSDVLGDDPSTIGSGPSMPDPSRFADAVAVLHRHELERRVPTRVIELLRRGCEGTEPETVKSTDPEAFGAGAEIIGSNRTARLAAAAEAQRLGYVVTLQDRPVTGDTVKAAGAWLSSVDHDERHCTISGGETTVEVRGRGRGGRNQEFALALVPSLPGSGLVVLSAGTDGVDGPTDAAGAFADGDTLRRAHAAGLDPLAALRDNDSYGFFDRLGDLLRCGPTGTNVMDLKLAIRLPSAC